ncbi:hypothetical protein ACJX0J_020893, partial [Zea mays]
KLVCVGIGLIAGFFLNFFWMAGSISKNRSFTAQGSTMNFVESHECYRTNYTQRRILITPWTLESFVHWQEYKTTSYKILKPVDEILASIYPISISSILVYIYNKAYVVTDN